MRGVRRGRYRPARRTPVGARGHRPEQHRRRSSSDRYVAEAVPTASSRAQPGVRDRPGTHRPGIHAHSDAGGRARSTSGRRRAGTLAVVQAVVTNQGSGWTFTHRRAAAVLRARVAARIGRGRRRDDGRRHGSGGELDGAEPAAVLRRARRAGTSAAAATLGRRTAELHLALAAEPDPAFAPEPLDSGSLGALSAPGTRRRRGRAGSARARRETLAESSAGQRGHGPRTRAPALLERCSATSAHLRRAASAFASTATITSARSSGPRRTSSSSISKASRRARSQSVGRSTRR